MAEKTKPKRERITSIQALNDAIAAGKDDFAVLLGGGVFSRKTIQRKGDKYRITNHIDESTQTLSEEQLLDEHYSIIGEAMELNALVVMD